MRDGLCIAQRAAETDPADPAAVALAGFLVGLAQLPELMKRLVAVLERPMASPDVSERPGPTAPAELARIVELLEHLLEAVGRIGRPEQQLAFRKEELAEALGVSKGTLTRAIHRGDWPGPDVRLGTVPLWSVESCRAALSRSRIKK
jgi:hypothetical protein